MHELRVLLLYAIALTPLVGLIGFLIWLIGAFQKGSSDIPENDCQFYGRKVMLFALFAFLVGFGSCLGVNGLQLLLEQVF